MRLWCVILTVSLLVGCKLGSKSAPVGRQHNHIQEIMYWRLSSSSSSSPPSSPLSLSLSHHSLFGGGVFASCLALYTVLHQYKKIG